MKTFKFMCHKATAPWQHASIEFVELYKARNNLITFWYFVVHDTTGRARVGIVAWYKY